MFTRAAMYFLASVLLTAIFSYSLQKFLDESFTMLSLKTVLIPCFTWTILLISSYASMQREQWWRYVVISGWICMIGSAMLVPCGVYNFIAVMPDIRLSVISVAASVVLMSLLYYRNLPAAGVSLSWWWAFNILICINMTLFYLSIK
jgi:hypothetical protein